MKDIIEVAELLEDSGLLREGVNETTENETKEQKGFLSMLLVTLGASLSGNILAGKGINKAGEGAVAKRQVWGIVRAGYENKKIWKATTKRQDHKNKMDF